MAIDQAHEQVNAIINGDEGAVGVSEKMDHHPSSQKHQLLDMESVALLLCMMQLQRRGCYLDTR